MSATTACSMATAEQIPSASAWCRRMIGCAVKTAFLMIFATLRISGIRLSRTSLFTSGFMFSGSARASSAFSIRPRTGRLLIAYESGNRIGFYLELVVAHHDLADDFYDHIQFHFGVSPTPAFTNAATFWVPDSSTIVKIVGPLVCLIWATSPSIATVFPCFVARSAILTVVDVRSTCWTW